jgi:hypothetical protein
VIFDLSKRQQVTWSVGYGINVLFWIPNLVRHVDSDQVDTC